MSARDSLEMATRGGAACLGREGELGEIRPGAVGDIALWRLEGLRFAGAVSDPIEAWLRCGPLGADTTIVAGNVVVEHGSLVSSDVEERLATHRRVAERMQA